MLKGSPKVGILKVGKPKAGRPIGGSRGSGTGTAPAINPPKMQFNSARNSQLVAVLDDL